MENRLSLVQLEATVLGSVLARPKNAGAVMAVSAPEDFTDVWRAVFEAMRELHFAGEPIDRVTLLHRLGDDYGEVLREVLKWAVEEPTTYCRMLREERTLEEVRTAALELNTCETLESATEAAQRIADTLAGRQLMKKVTAQDAAMAFVDRVGKPREWITWGMDALDHPSTHTTFGDFVVIGGRPSAGKSMLAAQLANTLAKRYRVAFFNLETEEEDLTDRNIARESGVPLDAIMNGNLTEGQNRRVLAAAEKYYSLRFDAFAAAGSTVEKIEAEVLAGRYQIVFVDYLQLLRGHGSGRSSQYEKITEISMALHTMARRRHCVVVALAQLNREADGGQRSKGEKPTPPSMASFKDSGQIEADADLAMILYLEDPRKQESRRILKVAKNKRGRRADTILLKFDGATQRFTEEFPEYRPRPKPNKKPGAEYKREELPL